MHYKRLHLSDLVYDPTTWLNEAPLVLISVWSIFIICILLFLDILHLWHWSPSYHKCSDRCSSLCSFIIKRICHIIFVPLNGLPNFLGGAPVTPSKTPNKFLRLIKIIHSEYMYHRGCYNSLFNKNKFLSCIILVVTHTCLHSGIIYLIKSNVIIFF